MVGQFTGLRKEAKRNPAENELTRLVDNNTTGTVTNYASNAPLKLIANRLNIQ